MFEKWMRENGAWEEFKANFQDARIVDYTLNEYMSDMVERGLIAGAFFWGKYSDGNVDWEALDDKWGKHLNEKDK